MNIYNNNAHNQADNDDLEQVFQKLATIEQVETSTGLYTSIVDNLYTSITNKIKKQEMISLVWIRTMAAILILFFSFEIIIVGKKYYANTSTNLEKLVSTNPNTLYDE